MLPIHVANKIAAGEVVERPASVVKELMENAIDAQATQIDVLVTGGGRKLLRITDDGVGMSRDDALMAIERHATSKIRDVEDIEKIGTMGFRGEALAAVSSVARLRLTTCARGENVGTEIVVNGGVLQDVRDGGFPIGTGVEVRDLFYNVPARRKFLRTEQTELYHIRDVFILQALAHPTLGMSLSIDGRIMYRLPPVDELDDRLRELFSPELVQSLKRVNHVCSGIRISGRVSGPENYRSDRNEQYLFVNHRPTGPAILSYAINEAYRGVLPKGRFPSVFLFLEMDPSSVDVNVHPTKKEIRFRQPGFTRDAVIEALQTALHNVPDQSVSDRMGEELQATAPQIAPSTPNLPIQDLPPSRSFNYPRNKARISPPTDGLPIDEVFSIVDPSPHPNAKNSNVSPSAMVDPEESIAIEDAAGQGEGPWSWCRVLGQIAGFYVVMETEAGMVLMDPRAAHERVLYDKLVNAHMQSRVTSQTLLLPVSVDVSARDAARIRKHIDVFKDLGFGLSEFGGNSFAVDALPACMADTPVPALIREMASSLDATGGRRSRQENMSDILIQAACRAAVGFRQHLSLDEIERLVVDLARTQMPYTSPRGRPTLMFTSTAELNRKFGREG